MSNVDPVLELIILAGVVAYIAYTYWRLIGTRSEDTPQTVGEIINLHAQDNTLNEQAKTPKEIQAKGDGIYVFEKHFPGFETQHFLQGAEAAFRMVVEAFASGDKKTLTPLLSAQLMQDFSKAIDQREKSGEKLHTKVMHVNKFLCEKASIKDGIARGTFRIHSSQINQRIMPDGTVEETPHDTYDSIVDLWVFEKNLADSDPNWTLVQTLPAE